MTQNNDLENQIESCDSDDDIFNEILPSNSKSQENEEKAGVANGKDKFNSSTHSSLNGGTSLDDVTFSHLDIPKHKTFEEILCGVAGTKDLEKVEEIDLRIIAREISIQKLSLFLPNLQVLRLRGSAIESIRELGNDLKNLRVLDVTNCQLQSLDGVMSLYNLEELYASGNDISDISYCAGLMNIRVLRLKNNRIEDIQSLGFLSLCEELRDLSTENCPISMTNDYRRLVKFLLPQLLILDSQYFDDSGSSAMSCMNSTFSTIVEEEEAELQPIIRQFEILPPPSQFYAPNRKEEIITSNSKEAPKEETNQVVLPEKEVKFSRNVLKLPPIKNHIKCPIKIEKRPKSSSSSLQSSSFIDPCKSISSSKLVRPATSRNPRNKEIIGDLETVKEKLRSIPNIKNPFSYIEDPTVNIDDCYERIFREVPVKPSILKKPSKGEGDEGDHATNCTLATTKQWRSHSATYRSNIT